MTPTVSEKEYFHIQRKLPYSPPSFFIVGDTLQIGSQNNPFFNYYETFQNTYPINDNGTMVNISPIDWLRRVKNNTLNPDLNAFRSIAFDTANHFLMLARELIWENIRISEFPTTPSRQKAIWLISSLTVCHTWKDELLKDIQDFKIVKVKAIGCAHDCDASFLLGDVELLSSTYEKARKYWRGEISPTNTKEETLFTGTLQVLEIIEPSQ